MNKKDQQLIASFYASPMFSVFQKLLEERIQEIRMDKNKRDTQFETIYQLGNSDGRQSELIELLKTLESYYKRYSKE